MLGLPRRLWVKNCTMTRVCINKRWHFFICESSCSVWASWCMQHKTCLLDVAQVWKALRSSSHVCTVAFGYPSGLETHWWPGDACLMTHWVSHCWTPQASRHDQGRRSSSSALALHAIAPPCRLKSGFVTSNCYTRFTKGHKGYKRLLQGYKRLGKVVSIPAGLSWCTWNSVGRYRRPLDQPWDQVCC